MRRVLRFVTPCLLLALVGVGCDEPALDEQAPFVNRLDEEVELWTVYPDGTEQRWGSVDSGQLSDIPVQECLDRGESLQARGLDGAVLDERIGVCSDDQWELR